MAVAASDVEKLRRLRAELPATSATGYFNAGTNGPLSRRVHETIVAAAERELIGGRIIPGIYEGHADRNDRVREVLASIFGGKPHEYAITRSTNDGLNIALNGIDWNRGDEVVTTALEHPGLMAPLALLANRRGVVIRVADVGDGSGDVVAAIERTMSARTRVIALSHVLWSSGAVLPLSEIAAMADRHGAMVVADAAQSAGQVPVNLGTSGIAAYAMSGQKWLCGPEGTGALYVRESRFADISPTHVRYAQADLSGYVLPASGARRYEMGEAYAPAVLGLEAALLWLRDEVGFDWLYGRIAKLADRFIEGLDDTAGVTVRSPRGKIGGLVCFNVEGMPPQDVAAALYERGFTIRFVAYPPGPTVARASIGWWNTEDEVDALVREVALLADQAASATELTLESVMVPAGTVAK
ncbi:MAG: aminotransferase class V-fold PLP-dependent enzyme [Chloroflexota bacterium]|nr:aminotransferase class V-fold PLP-dependent enzyme [Chloroflexota bacterium]